MASAVPIGQLFTAILERCERMHLLHLWVQSLADPGERKAFIMKMREQAGLTDDETSMLLECYELEGA